MFVWSMNRTESEYHSLTVGRVGDWRERHYDKYYIILQLTPHQAHASSINTTTGHLQATMTVSDILF